MTDIFYTLFRLQGDQDWLPPINMYESDEEFWIEVELAGMDKDKIKVEYEEGILSISGIRRKGIKSQKHVCCQLEMEYGTFYRFVTFDVPVEPTKIEALYEKGILEIHVPKKLCTEEDQEFD